MSSHFPFDEDKATEVAAIFMRKHGGKINHMKLIKLAYLLDRLSIKRRGAPIVGGWYLSMKNGPVTSELLDLVNAGQLGTSSGSWKKHVADRAEHEIELQADPGYDHLSESEVALIEEIWKAFGARSQWQLVDWCHSNCSEWTQLQSGHKSIQLEDICASLGLAPEANAKVLENADEMSFLDSVFCR